MKTELKIFIFGSWLLWFWFSPVPKINTSEILKTFLGPIHRTIIGTNDFGSNFEIIKHVTCFGTHSNILGTIGSSFTKLIHAKRKKKQHK